MPPCLSLVASFLCSSLVLFGNAAAVSNPSAAHPESQLGSHFLHNFYEQNKLALSGIGDNQIGQLFADLDKLKQKILFPSANYPEILNNSKKCANILGISEANTVCIRRGPEFNEMRKDTQMLIGDLKHLTIGGKEKEEIHQEVFARKLLLQGAKLLKELCKSVGLNWDQLERRDWELPAPAEGGPWALVRGLVTAWQDGDAAKHREWFWQRLPLYKRMLTDPDFLLRMAADTGNIGKNKRKNSKKRRKRQNTPIIIGIGIGVAIVFGIAFYLFNPWCPCRRNSSDSGSSEGDIEMTGTG